MKHFPTYDGHDATILKFDEELGTPRSAIVENNNNNNYSSVCSTIRKLSRHKQTSEIETGSFSGWTTEKEEFVVIPEDLEQNFQTVELQESEIIFKTNHFVFEESKISCYQIQSFGLQPRDKAAMLGVNTIELFLEEFT